MASEPATRFSNQARARERERERDARLDALVPPDPPPLPGPGPVERPMILRIKHPAVRAVAVDLPCQHLIGQDVAAVLRAGWLPNDDRQMNLSEERARHEELIAEVGRREAYLRKLKVEVSDERRKRVAAMAEGDAKARPLPDASKLISQAEDRLLASQVALVAYADQVLGEVRARIHGAWGERRRALDRENAERLERAKAELAAAEKAIERTFALNEWCDRATSDQQPSVPWEQMKHAKPKGPQRSIYDRPLSPTRA